MDIFVGNLAPEVTEEDLLDLFDLYGDVESVTIEYDDETGESKGVACVTMVRREDALEAIEALNKTPLQGQRIKVRHHIPARDNKIGVE